MPREKIHRSDEGEPFEVHIGWQRDQHVQVGIVATDWGSLLDVVYDTPHNLGRIGMALEAALAATGRVITDDLHNDHNPDHQVEFTDDLLGKMVVDAVESVRDVAETKDSVWVSPTRSGINEMIRLLRKARDAAFGRDE